MLSDHRWRKPFSVALTISASILLLLVGSHFALANKETHPLSQAAATNSPTGWGDDGIYEVGVEWENVFPNPADNRNYWDVSCDGLYNFLIGSGWTPRFRWTNYDAFEKDAKRGSLGGWENSYVDSVDLAMICTHGSYGWDNTWHGALSSVYYGSTRDDHWLTPGDASLAYGDKDLEYLAFDACHVLDDPSLIYWASTFNGLHLLLGFSNNMHPDPYGDGWLWGFAMTSPDPLSVTQAWFMAVDFNQPSDTCARIIGENLSNFNEHWWNTWPDPIVDSEKVIWSHCSHGIIYGRNNIEQTEVISMPMMKVHHRTVDEAYVRNTIASAFDMTGDIGMDNIFYTMADTTGGITRTLLVDSVTGSFSFHNLSKLWTTPVVTPTLPSYRVADILINNWFSSTHAKGLPGAWYRSPNYIYDYEGIFNEILSNAENGGLQGQITKNIPTDLSMTYPRVINAKSTTANGTQIVNYPIFGPGARMVVYLGDGGEIIGAQGGSRDVEVLTDMVEILNPDVVWSMFLANPNLAIGEIPVIADTITHTVPILGYYEMSYLIPQDELIPVWEFGSYFYLDGNLVAEDIPVFLPAATNYLPPQAAILGPLDGSTFSTGKPIEFKGSATGGTPPYIYKWSSSSDGYLANTINLVTRIGSQVRDNSLFTPTVSFQVTDANGLSSTATISLNIIPDIWLPLINK
jgi:hypothetical protein